ncbi:hypothetical protein [Palleronia sp.]|uniref:hypothetical protein n=1 Tax=Palleronia sp. TaxID=1940284 RepID=UPI0035C7D6C0
MTFFDLLRRARALRASGLGVQDAFDNLKPTAAVPPDAMQKLRVAVQMAYR